MNHYQKIITLNDNRKEHQEMKSVQNGVADFNYFLL